MFRYKNGGSYSNLSNDLYVYIKVYILTMILDVNDNSCLGTVGKLSLE